MAANPLVAQLTLLAAPNKTCRKCREPFPEAEFRREGDGGVTRYCARCQKARSQEKYRRYDLKRFYGITPEEYDAILVAQGGGCAVCGARHSVMRGVKCRLDVDHDHTTGKVRGILCNRCNGVVARMDEQPDLLESAAAYLRRFAK